MEISNPKRVLAVALEGSTTHLTRVIRDLTGTNPEQTSTSLAGTTHNLAIKTPYYTTEVPIWLDLIASPEEWAESFLSPEAKEVLEVLGGVMVVFALPPPSNSTSSIATSTALHEASTMQSSPVERVSSDNTSPATTSGPEGSSPSSTATPQPPTAQETRALLKQIGRVVSDGLGGWSWDGVSLCVGVGEADDVDEWEELAAGCGLEFVQVKKMATGSGVGRNEFGEKTGIPRILEALESNDWAQEDMDILEDLGIGSDDDDDDFGAFTGGQTNGRSSRKKDTDIDPESLDFGFDREDFEGLKRAIWTSGQEVDAFAPPITTTTTTATATFSSAAAGTDDNGAARPVTTKMAEDSTAQAALSRGDSIKDSDKTPEIDGTDDGIEQHLDYDDAEEVEKIERMMLKLSAVRDMAAGLPEDQRRRMAARAVGEVMREL